MRMNFEDARRTASVSGHSTRAGGVNGSLDVALTAGDRSAGIRRAALILSGLSALLIATSFVLVALDASQPLKVGAFAASGTLTLMAIAASVWSLLVARQRADWFGTAELLLDATKDPAMICDGMRQQVYLNPAARSILGIGTGSVGLAALPSHWSKAVETVVNAPENGAVGVGEEDELAWQITAETMEDGRHLLEVRPICGTLAPVAENLPVLSLGADGTVVFLNEPALAFLGGRPARLTDFIKTPLSSSVEIATVNTAQGEAQVFVALLPRENGRRDLAMIPLSGDIGPSATNIAETGTSSDWDRFENLPVPLLRLTPEGKVLRANRNAVRLVGQECREGVHLGDLTEGLGRPINDWLDEAASGYRISSPEFLRVTGSDRETFVQISLKPMEEDGELSLLAVLNDATELKTLEAQFVQSQKMQAIGQLAGGVAHDFNNLLTAISGHCDLLLLRHDQGDQDYADLMQINQNANRAASLVSQLLAFSRKQTLRPEEIDLRDTISDLTHLLNRLVGEKVTLSFSHDPMLSSIRADKRQLEQVLMNLVVNARDAIKDVGEIRIVTEGLSLTGPMERDRATVPPGDYVSVKVIDTGTGISADKLTKVFEPFYTTKRVGEGTGLGLSTAYGIIKQTGGYIFVDSTPGEGTCFTLLFRAFKSEAVKAVAAPEASKQSAKHADGVVLLVEDEAPVRAFASRALQLRGYTVLEAESGEQALEVLEDPDLHVDIFVTDVVMPGMDGPTWVRKALETRSGVRVIFVSGYAEEHFGDDQARIPNSVFLPKPFSLSELTRTVQDA